MFAISLQVVTAKVVSMGVSGENSSQESSSDSSPGSPSHHHHQHQQQQQQHHHHPVVGPNHEAENLLPSVVNTCVCMCMCLFACLCVCAHACVCRVPIIMCFPNLDVILYLNACSPDLQLSFLVASVSESSYVVSSEYL